MKTVALLIGGWSDERQVSLDKGQKVEAALLEAGYKVETIDVQKDLRSFLSEIERINPDVAFNNLYGTGGEDGVIQGVLEMLDIPYTHSGVMTSSIAMNKEMTKTIAKSVGVKVPNGIVAKPEDVIENNIMPVPFVAKPVAEGSSVGIYIIKNDNDFIPEAPKGWQGKDILVEEYIKGKELTVAVLDGKAQAVTEIVPKTEFFDYEAKYEDQSTEYVLPAPVPAEIADKAKENAEKVYKSIGCKGLARCDFRYDDTKDGVEGLYLLEINNQPGLTADSIGPSQVAYRGMDFPTLCQHLVESAYQVTKNKDKKHAA